MCERDEFIPNYERLFYVDMRLASRATTSSIHLINGVLHSNHIAAQEFSVPGSEFGIEVTLTCLAFLIHVELRISAF